MPVATIRASTLRRKQTIAGASGSANPSYHDTEAHNIDPWPALRSLDYFKGCKGRDSVTAHASADHVCILSNDQAFEQALPFWSAFSASEDARHFISCLCVGSSADDGPPLIAAAVDQRIAFWCSTPSSASNRKWKVHSTLIVSDGHITSLDIVNSHLLVGTESSLSLWRLESTGIPIWRRFWTKNTPAPIRTARFSPDASLIAAVVEGGQNVLLWQYQPRSSRPPQYQQRLFHPFHVINIVWRQPPEALSQSDVLVSYSVDSVARIWAPVIDEPTELRLWCTVQGSARSTRTTSNVRAFYLDPFVLSSALRNNITVLQRELQMIELGLGSVSSLSPDEAELQLDLKRTRLRRLEQLVSETPDMFLCLEDDGSVSVTAIANIDRRPPTLLQTFTVLRVPLPLPVPGADISSLVVLPLHTPMSCSSESAMMSFQLRTSSGTVISLKINPALFFDGRGLGVQQDAFHACAPSVSPVKGCTQPNGHASHLKSLVRSGNGMMLTSIATDETLSWSADRHYASSLRSCGGDLACHKLCLSEDGAYSASIDPTRGLVLSRRSSDGKIFTLIKPEPAEGFLHLAFESVGNELRLFAITAKGDVRTWQICDAAQPRELSLSSLPHSHLPFTVIASTVKKKKGDRRCLSLLTGDAGGSVDLWQADIVRNEHITWKRIQRVHKAKSRVTMMSLSAGGVLALITTNDIGEQLLTIVDTKTTSFSSGEDYCQKFASQDRIIAIDWSLAANSNGCLAIAFEHHILILCPARRSPIEEIRHGQRSAWSIAARVDLGSSIPSNISAICWLVGEQLVVASASLLFVYGPLVDNVVSSDGRQMTKHLAELAADIGGPVAQYHPSFLHQSALWHHLELAKTIIQNLHQAVSNCSAEDTVNTWQYTEAPLDVILREDGAGQRQPKTNDKSSIFDSVASDEESTDAFATDNIEALIDKLKIIRPPQLSDEDAAVLPILIRTIGEAHRERRGMDETGLRYMLALRLLLNLDTFGSEGLATESSYLSYRECVWAFHSENQEPLLGAIGAAYQSRFNWQAARATGIFAWLKNPQTLRTQAEAVARAQFMTGEDRDPVKCSLLYYALGKKKVVQGLWKQAVWHPEQNKMLQFLSRDFDEERWKTAAQKNAFALLSQRRYEFAASFFMLGDSLRDAVNVCVKNLNDLSLAIALARLKEGCDDGPVFTELLRTRLLPTAFEKGDRWLGSWVFWMLKRRDLAVRVIITPLAELLTDPDVASMLPDGQTCGNDNYDDASLALLFRQLKVKSLQTLKGLADVPEKKEFDFVLHTNRLLGRMGCHAIGVSLLHNWQFEPPVVPSSATQYHKISKHDLATLSRVEEQEFSVGTGSKKHARRESSHYSPPTSPRMPRRRSSLLQRRSSLINDLDLGRSQETTSGHQVDEADAMNRFLPSTPSQTLSQQETVVEEPVQQTPATEPAKKGISVFKTAAGGNSQQGAQEFDFGSFGF